MSHPGDDGDQRPTSPLVVEILDGALTHGTAALDPCLCCDGPVDDELSEVSELVVEKQERPVLEILQELVSCSELPSSSRLCRDCLAKVLRYHRLREALSELQHEMRRLYLQTASIRRLRSTEMAEEEEEEDYAMADLALPASPPSPSSPPSPASPTPAQPSPPSPPPAPPPPAHQADPEQEAADDGKSPQAVMKPSGGGGDSRPEINISIRVLKPTTDDLPPPGDVTPSLPLGSQESPVRPSPATERLTRHRPGLPCPECSAVLDSKTEMETHLTSVHKSGAAPYRCDECERTFHLESELTDHRRSQHDVRRKIRCTLCRKTFRSRHAYLEHQTSKHTGQKLIECPVCSERFKRRICLKRHMEVHRKHGSVHACEQCGEKFATIGRLRTHEKQRHDIQQPWRCESAGCAKSFRSRAALQVHSANHTGERPYGCDVCDKRFTTKHRLQVHHRIHTGERPFQCAQCGRQFAHRSNLIQHTALAHKTERSHHCTDCGRTFRRARQLETHRSSCHQGSVYPAPAAGFGAPVPGLSASTAGLRAPTAGLSAPTADLGTPAAGLGAPTAGLRAPTAAGGVIVPLVAAAVRRPSLTKQYKCSICQRAFLRLDNLRTHMFVHSDKKPYECRECGLGFIRRPQLQQHMEMAAHGQGLSDYIINEALFVMDMTPDNKQEGSVQLVPAGQSQVFGVLESRGTREDAGGPAVTQVVFKTATSNIAEDSSKMVQQEQPTICKPASPQASLDSPITRQNDHQIILKPVSPRADMDSPCVVTRRNDLDSPGMVSLDDRQIIFRPESPPVDLDSSEAGGQGS